MIKYGIIDEIDATKAQVKVKFEQYENIVSNWLRVVQVKTLEDQFYWMPDVGEQVVCIMEDGMNEGVVIGSIYSDKNPPPVTDENLYHKKFSDGTEITVDRQTSTISIDAPGDMNVDLGGNAAVNISGDADVSITGNCTVDITSDATVSILGNLDVTAMGECNVTAGTKAVISAPMVDVGMVPFAGIVHGSAPCPLMGTHIAGASVSCKVSL